MSECFPKLKSFAENLQVELDLFKHARKTDLNNAAGVDTSDLLKNIDLTRTKSDVDKLHTDKLKIVLSKTFEK